MVAAGLLVIAGALWLVSTVQLSDGYGRVAATLALLGTGMGLTMAPATSRSWARSRWLSAPAWNYMGVSSA